MALIADEDVPTDYTSEERQLFRAIDAGLEGCPPLAEPFVKKAAQVAGKKLGIKVSRVADIYEAVRQERKSL